MIPSSAIARSSRAARAATSAWPSSTIALISRRQCGRRPPLPSTISSIGIAAGCPVTPPVASRRCARRVPDGNSPLAAPRQIERARSLPRRRRRRLGHRPGRVAEREEARAPARLGLVRVHREAVVVPPAGMGDVMGQAAEAAAGPAIVHIEHQRRCRPAWWDAAQFGGFQALKRTPPTYSPGAIGGASAAPRSRCRPARSARPPSRDLRLHPLDRAVDIARGAAAGRLLAQHVPGFQRVAQFELGAAAPRSRRSAGSGTPDAGRTRPDRGRSRARPAPPARRGNPRST